MFFVSGTKRSGTSMWMQAIRAAGLEVVGDPFPKNWGGGALRGANPEGFYEGRFREGVFFGTNPDPTTGEYLRPQQLQGLVAKVFVPGVVRSELAFIDGVIANVREWREYTASVNRLWDLDDRQRAVETPDAPTPLRVPGPLEWWHENISLIRDQRQRGFPLCLQTYRQVLADPTAAVERALALVGRGDVGRAVATIKPPSRPNLEIGPDPVEPRIARVFDELYHAIEERKPLEGSLLRLLVKTDRELGPQFVERKTAAARNLAAAGSTPPSFFMLAAALG